MDTVSRRDFALAAGALVSAAGTAEPALAEMNRTVAAPPVGISRNHPAIHQEVDFASNSIRVFRALTEADQFERIQQLTASEWQIAAPAHAPALIDARLGGTFALFGGYISGFNLELVPGTRIIQAWRVGSWPAGKYSVASFALSRSGDTTRLTFDHTGFPDEAAEHLARGWHGHYWEPLAKILRA